MQKLALALVSVAAVACGGISSKEDAARALGRIQSASSSAGGKAQALSPEGITITLNAEAVSGTTGSVTISGTITLGDAGVNMNLTLKYDNFSPDGVATLDGELNYTITMTGTQTAATMDAYMKGKVTLSGTDEDGTVEMDIHMISEVTTGGTAAAPTFSAKAKLKGTVTADGNTFTFDNEEFVVVETSGA